MHITVQDLYMYGMQIIGCEMRNMVEICWNAINHIIVIVKQQSQAIAISLKITQPYHLAYNVKLRIHVYMYHALNVPSQQATYTRA